MTLTADTNVLTIDLVTIDGTDPEGIEVVVQMANPMLIYPVGPNAPNHETIYPTTQTKFTDAQGIAQFNLLPSNKSGSSPVEPLAGQYRVTIGGYVRIITMPDSDIRYSNLPGAQPAQNVADPFAFADLRNLSDNLSAGDRTEIRRKIGATSGVGTGSGQTVYSFDLAYMADDKYHGSFVPVLSDLPAAGALIAFETPDTVPVNDLAPVLRLPVGGIDTDFIVFDGPFGAPITNSQLVPNTIYWGYIVGQVAVFILSSTVGGAIVRRVVRSITNAELKTLDTDYIELIPAPGAGKFLLPKSFSVTKRGSDPANRLRTYYAAATEDTVLTQAAAAAAASGSNPSALPLPAWTAGETRWIWIGTPSNQPDILPRQFRRNEANGGSNGIVESAVADATTLTVAGVEINWWRVDTNAELGDDYSEGSLRLTIPSATPSNQTVSLNTHFALMYNVEDADEPLYYWQPRFGSARKTAGLSVVAGLDDDTEFHDWFQLAAGAIYGAALGGQVIHENEPLLFGALITNTPITSYYDMDAWDAFWQGVDDATIDIVVNYEIHAA